MRQTFNVTWDDPTLPEMVELEVPNDIDPFDFAQVISDLLTDQFGEVPTSVVPA